MFLSLWIMTKLVDILSFLFTILAMELETSTRERDDIFRDVYQGDDEDEENEENERVVKKVKEEDEKNKKKVLNPIKTLN